MNYTKSSLSEYRFILTPYSMASRKMLYSLILSLVGSFANADQVKTMFLACGNLSSPVTLKKVCYVKDLQKGDASIKVFIGAGLNLSGGIPLLSASAQVMTAVELEMPIRPGVSLDQLKAEAISKAEEKYLELSRKPRMTGIAVDLQSPRRCESPPTPNFIEELLERSKLPARQCKISDSSL